MLNQMDQYVDYISYDNNVARLGASHPALFEGRMPKNSDLADGWYLIVDQLCAHIDGELGPELSREFVTLQIKEKFGTLKFYWRLGTQGDLRLDIFTAAGSVSSGVSKATPSRSRNAKDINQARERVRAHVDATCAASAQLCQRCGSPGVLCKSRTGWASTLCNEHSRERAKGEDSDRG